MLAPIDLTAVNARLKAVVEEAKANDPKALRAEIARLKTDQQKAQQNITENIPADAAAIAEAEQRGYQRAISEHAQRWHERGFGEGFRACVEGMQFALNETNGHYGAILAKFSAAVFEDIRKEVADHAPQRLAAARSAASSASPAIVRTPVRFPAKAMARTATNGKSSSLPPGERALLVAACQFQGVGRDQLSVLTGYKRSSRDAYIQRLREKGYVEVAGELVTPTPDGSAALGNAAEQLPTGPTLQDYWRNRLPEGERKVLDALINFYPGDIERSALDEITGYKRSSRDAYIQRLKARRLVAIKGSAVRASAMLF